MIISTTPTLEGRPIHDCLGIVTGEVIIGADAIVAVDIYYEVVGQGGSMLKVSASGTAVRL